MDQENLIITCEIFKTILNQQVKEILQKMNKNVNNFKYFKDIEKQVNDLISNGQSILSDTSLIESIIVENLQIPKVNIYDYLLTTQQRVLQEQASALNQQNQERMNFFQEILQIIQNYIVLAVNTPELFPEGNFLIQQKLFQNYNYDTQIKTMLQLISLNHNLQIASILYQDIKDSKQNIYYLIKNAIQTETVNKVTIFDGTWDKCLDIIMLLLQIKDFKKQFLLEITKINNYQKAKQIEQNCFYGYILSNTMIPYDVDSRRQLFDKQAVDKIESCKTKGQYEKTCQVNQKEYFKCIKKNILKNYKAYKIYDEKNNQ